MFHRQCVLFSIIIALCCTYFPCVQSSSLQQHLNRKVNSFHAISRGGSSISSSSRDSLRKYRLEQQHLLQLRSTFLSEALAVRGISIGPTLTDVATPDGSKPPKEVDWDCYMSTNDDPKSCLYSFDAEINTKVICPTGTDQYISLKSLNRLRRTDPTKVEPMWHSQYAILRSWFSDESPYSLLQFVGWKGFVISSLLLDLGGGMFLRGILTFIVVSVFLLLMPLIEVMSSRVLTSSFLWAKWFSWGRFVHAALPLKILIGQMVWKFSAATFGKLESVVRDYVIELECNILEECTPVTSPNFTTLLDKNEDNDSSDEELEQIAED